MPNRLAGATSPYLEQHADNPVDWYPWGQEAFDAARSRDVPLMISIGYAACHWCHVMAHESFEDPATAADLAGGFVAVKVDREERPDVDAAYLGAATALTGQAGWPLTVFATPDGRPFFAGTYYPPRPVGGRPAFRQVLAAVNEAWTQRRGDVEESGRSIAAALAASASASLRGPLWSGDEGGRGSQGPAGVEDLAAAVRVLAGEEDAEHGGFGGAPKFPPSSVCEFLLRHAAGDPATSTVTSTATSTVTSTATSTVTSTATSTAASTATSTATGPATTTATGPLAAGLAARTLAAMARSGMYDQVAGGFARYAVDDAWEVPHFEKMLSDNAQLARVYLHWWRASGAADGLRVAVETCEWMLEALLTDEGGFASSLDADTRGVEGSTYVWTLQELRECLGEDDAAWASSLLGVGERGNHSHTASTARLLRDVWGEASERDRWVSVRRVLRAARSRRSQPQRDDKVVAAWNGLAIAALAETGALAGRPDFVAAALTCARVLLDTHLLGGRLRRTSRAGVVGDSPGVLEDYGDLAEGLLTLAAVTGEAPWAWQAGDLLEVVADHFMHDGAFRDVADDEADPRLEWMGHGADPSDGDRPSGTSAAAGAMLTWAALTGRVDLRDRAATALSASRVLARSAPRFAGWALAVAQAAAGGPVEIAVIGAEGDPRREDLHREALATTSPGAVVAVGPSPGAPLPLVEGRPMVRGGPAAYVCRDFFCRAPVTTAEQLRAELHDHGRRSGSASRLGGDG